MHDGTQHSCHSRHSAERHSHSEHGVSVPADPEGLCERPSRGPAGPGLLTVPWHCCLSRKTSVGATQRLWMKAVWSGENVVGED